MTVSVFSSLDDHYIEWDALVAKMAIPSPFLLSWWLKNCSNGTFRLVAIFDEDGQLIGGIALDQDVQFGCTRLRFASTGVLEPDHLDVVAAPEDQQRVTSEVFEYFAGLKNAVIDLVGVSEASLIPAFLSERSVVSEIDGAPYVKLPESADEYLQRLQGTLRSTIKRSSKRLTNAGYVATKTTDANAARDAMVTLHELHTSRWDNETQLGPRWESLTSAVCAAMDQGHATITELRNEHGDVIASEIDFVVNGRTSFYQAGRKTEHEFRGSGSVLRFDIVADCIARGDREFDLLRGTEPYKSQWKTSQRRLLRVRQGFGARGNATVAAVQLNLLFDKPKNQFRDMRGRLRKTREARANSRSFEIAPGRDDVTN